MSEEKNDDYNYDEEENTEEVFELENLIIFLEKNNYSTNTVFMYEKRIVFLFIINNNNGNELFLYIPSSHTIQIKDKNKNVNIIKLIEIDELEEEEKYNIFNNKNENVVKQIEERFDRLTPVLEEEKFKLCFIKNKNMVFINRHNSIDKFNLNTNINEISGIYLVTDLEYFYDNYNNIEKEINMFEKRFNNSLINPVNNYIKEYTNVLKIMDNLVKKNINSSIEKFEYRKNKIDEISEKLKVKSSENTKQKEELKQLKSELRKDHLNYLYNIENISFLIKKLKDTI
jgi:hypothetical protein